MNKVKPKDVMMALECCNDVWETCSVCPMNHFKDFCQGELHRAALALLREKDSEIESLKGAVRQYKEERKYHFEMSRKRIDDFITEFVDRLKYILCVNNEENSDFFDYSYTLETIDQIAMEMKRKE